MAWTYSGDPSTSDLDRLRFVVGDVDEDFQLLTDAEINFALIDSNNDINKAAIKCFRALMAKFAKEVNYGVGPERIEAEKRYQHYASMLKMFEQKLSQYGPPSGAPDTDGVFDVGMHDNR